MNNPELIKEYPGWPWLLVPFRPKAREAIPPVVASGQTTGPAQSPAPAATGRPRNRGKSLASVDWELAVRAKP